MEEKRQTNNVLNHVPDYYISLSPYEILNFVASPKNYTPVKTKGKLIYESGFPRLIDEYGYMVSLENVQLDYPEGTIVEIEGIIRCHLHPNGGIFPRINVKKITPIEDINCEMSHTEQEILSLLKTNPIPNYGFYGYFEKIVKTKISSNNKIHISVIHGKDAQTHKDFEQALFRELGNLKDVVSLSFYETSLSNDIDLANTIKNIRNSDAIFIVRGGGKKEELEKIGGKETCKAIIENTIPVYVAIGHSLDKRVALIEKVAQTSFPTPSLAGTELGKLIRTVYENLIFAGKIAEEKIKNEVHQREIQSIKTAYENQIKSLKDQNKTYLLLIAILALALLFFIFK